MTRAPDILVVPDHGTPWVLALIRGDVVRVPMQYPGLRIGRTIHVQRLRYKLDGTRKQDDER
jgi:hypothetical protein